MDALTLDAAALDERFRIADRLHFAVLHGGIVAILSHDGARAVVALQGGQVLTYSTPDCGEVLWLSPQAKLGTGKAVRGGIPICWPWFGPHPEGGGRPAHGFVRTQFWRVVCATAAGAATRLTLACEEGVDGHPHWPHSARLHLEIALGRTLSLSLTTQNTGPSAFELTQALHSYFRIADITSVEVRGLETVRFIDQLDPAGLKSEPGPVRISGEVDRIYQSLTTPVTIRDDPARLIEIASRGSASAVLWNPWIEKSARLGDMGCDGYRHMLCFETANAGADAVTLAPGESHTLTTAISASVQAPPG